MNTRKKTAFSLYKSVSLAAFFVFSGASFGASLNPMIDDFSDASHNSLGIPRQFLTDALAGGGTTTEQQVSDGVISVAGEIIPPRGQPGWASTVLLFDPQGLPQDVSAFDGIRLVVKVNAGSMSITANSIDVTNFDYHAAPIMVAADGKFHEIHIPFASMKRAWSEQTPLNTTAINSVTFVAYSLQKDAFDFEVDEVSLYQTNPQ